MLAPEVRAVTSADGALVLEAPIEQVPVVPFQEATIAQRHYVEPNCVEAIGDPWRDVFVKENPNGHDRRYPLPDARRISRSASWFRCRASSISSSWAR